MNAGARPRRIARPALALLAGLLFQAITTYLVLVLAGRSLGASGFGALTALYVLTTSLATGLYLPLEQEIARRRGDERGRQTWDGSLLPRGMKFGLILAAAAVAVVLVALPLTLRLMAHDPWLVAALCVALPGYACCFVSRGEFAGNGNLARYGVQLAAEGGSRLAGAVLLVVAHVHSPGWFALLFAAAPWLAFLVSVYGWSRPAGAHPIQRGPALARAVGLLAIGCLASQLLINAGPLVVSLLASAADRYQAGVFLAALVIVRVPVFLFTAVQPSFLPAMAEHAAADRRDRFLHLITRVIGACTVLVAVSAVGAVVVGPWVVRVLFGFEQNLSRWTYFQMTLSVGLFLVSAIIAQALLGRGKHMATTLGWLAGIVGLAVGTAFGHGAVARASAGFLSGALVATGVLGWLLFRALRRWPTRSVSADAASLREGRWGSV